MSETGKALNLAIKISSHTLRRSFAKFAAFANGKDINKCFTKSKDINSDLRNKIKW